MDPNRDILQVDQINASDSLHGSFHPSDMYRHWRKEERQKTAYSDMLPSLGPTDETRSSSRSSSSKRHVPFNQTTIFEQPHQITKLLMNGICLVECSLTEDIKPGDIFVAELTNSNTEIHRGSVRAVVAGGSD